MEIKFTGAGKIQRITIPDDMVFKGNLDLSDMGQTELPDLSAVTVTGDFDCSWNNLTTLAGAPQSVGGDFICDKESLKAEYAKIQLAVRFAAKQKEISGRLTGQAKQRKKQNI